MERRRFLALGAAASSLVVAGCAAPAAYRGPVPAAPVVRAPVETGPSDAEARALYGPRPDERFPLAAVDPALIPRRYWRQRVAYTGRFAPGTLHVDTATFHLFLVEPQGTAMRYGVSLGRAGFEWSGRGDILRKRAWPKWTPPDSMIERQPELEKWSIRNGGMPPGLDNPLGARALYIFEDGVDTLYRVHGTPFPQSIGTAASSGCVRMVNQDVIDLYRRVKPGGEIVVT